jgi:nucleolar protein 58
MTCSKYALTIQPGRSISKKLSINVSAKTDSTHSDLWRGIRSQLAALLDGLDPKDLTTMNLGLSHSLSRFAVPAFHPVQVTTFLLVDRFKLKFSPDKVDTMVVQAIALLDDLDKEINVYSMRVKVRLFNPG